MNRKRDQAYRGKITASPLDELFGATVDEATSNFLPLDKIRLPEQQPRRYFDPRKMEELAYSVREHGVLEPVLVRPLKSGQYELVAGERRYRAAQTVGLDEIPVTVRELDDNEALQLALIENLQREDLNPIEETEGILQLLALKLNYTIQDVTALLYRMANESKGNVNRNVTVSPEEEVVQQVFSSLGSMKWESFVRNRLPLRNLSEDVLAALREGKIAYTKAQVIARIEDSETRQMILEEATGSDLSLAEIREKVKVLKPEVRHESSSESLKHSFKDVFRRLQQSRSVWKHPEKAKKLRTLLKQIEEVLE